MRKFQNFSTIHILREINFEECRSSETAVFVLKVGNFQPSKSAEIHKKSKSRASKYVQMADFALLESPTLILGKI